MPALRQIPTSGRVVKFDEVIDALQELNGNADDIDRTEEPRRSRAGRTAAVIPRRVRLEAVFGIELSPAAIIVSPLDSKSRSPKSSSSIAHSGC